MPFPCTKMENTARRVGLGSKLRNSILEKKRLASRVFKFIF